MATYFLQKRKADGARLVDEREFIDDHLHDGCVELASVEADSWRQAREMLGG
jgi:hypothetical protein